MFSFCKVLGNVIWGRIGDDKSREGLGWLGWVYIFSSFLVIV